MFVLSKEKHALKEYCQHDLNIYVMIEVFKTNINCPEKAKQLLEQIHKAFHGYKANFDLDDCDRILRVASSKDSIESVHLINWLKALGCDAEILPDN